MILKSSMKSGENVADILEPVYEVFSREDACVSDGVLALYQLLVRLDVEKQFMAERAGTPGSR